MGKKKQKSQISTEAKPQELPEVQTKGNKGQKPLNKSVGKQPSASSDTAPPKSLAANAHSKAKKESKAGNHPKKNDAGLKLKSRKPIPTDREPKAGKRKHDMFFAPPEPSNVAEEEKEALTKPTEPTEAPDAYSQAVIETIKIPAASPEPESTAQAILATRSGVVSVVDKANKKRKRSNIDVVAELEKDAKKVVRTDTSLGAGLEVDGWD